MCQTSGYVIHRTFYCQSEQFLRARHDPIYYYRVSVCVTITGIPGLFFRKMSNRYGYCAHQGRNSNVPSEATKSVRVGRLHIGFSKTRATRRDEFSSGHKLGPPRRYLRRFRPGIEIEENGDKSIPNVSPFDITWLRSGIRFYQRREWK